MAKREQAMLLKTLRWEENGREMEQEMDRACDERPEITEGRGATTGGNKLQYRVQYNYHML